MWLFPRDCLRGALDTLRDLLRIRISIVGLSVKPTGRGIEDSVESLVLADPETIWKTEPEGRCQRAALFGGGGGRVGFA